MCLIYWEVNELPRGNWSSQHYVKIAATNTTDKYPLSINEKKLTNISVSKKSMGDILISLFWVEYV